MTNSNSGEQGGPISSPVEGSPDITAFAVNDVPGEFQGEIDIVMGEAVDALTSRTRNYLASVSVLAAGAVLGEVAEAAIDATPGIIISGGIRGATAIAFSGLVIKAVDKGREAAYGVYHANYVSAERRRISEAPESSRFSSRVSARANSLNPYSTIRAYRKERKRKEEVIRSVHSSGGQPSKGVVG